ncbi:MAG: hypothetical protein SW833_14835 [Cyanobacteriota bacterium]|nr:hypothetical protein [Cyanobacteriota bacterium]
MTKKNNNFYLAVITPIIIFWLLLYFLGYPPPSVDDLAFTGAAINLVESGEFVNPWLAWWDERLIERFFIQPPFHQYTLAGWLLFFGISTRSFLLFNCICYCVFSSFAALILKHYDFSKTTSFGVTLFFSFWMSSMGFRQDALGMAYLAVGLWFLCRDRVFRYFFGFCFLGAALLSAPITITYSFPFASAILCHNFISKKVQNRYITVRALSLLGAIIVIFLLFLLCIDFKLGLFLSDLSWHSSFRRQPITEVIPAALWIVSIGYGKIIHGSLFSIYTILCCFVFLKKEKFSRKLKVVLTTLNIALCLNFFVYVSTIVGIFSFFCWTGVILIWSEIQLQKTKKIILSFLCIVVFAVNNSLSIISILGSSKGSDVTYREVQKFVSTYPNKTYVMDSAAVRFAFDYKLPVEIIDWTFSVPAPLAYPISLSQKPNNAVWIIAAAKGAIVRELPDFPRAKVLGYEFQSVPRNPYALTIIE